METLRSVDKFGGSSMSTPCSVHAVASIIKKERLQVIAVSAPGKIPGGDKVTDLLLQQRYEEVFERIEGLVQGLGLPVERSMFLGAELDRRITQKDSASIIAFGEYASARILTWYLKQYDPSWQFVDATRLVRFGEDAAHVTPTITKYVKRPIVVPGFYGRCCRTGSIKLFSRGGGDITGALLAVALKAPLYQNWTDVDGVYTSDPKTGVFTQIFHAISYRELTRLAQKGARVFHPGAVRPVEQARIPTRIRNTFRSEHLGTLVLPRS
jgi:aspartate kinase